MTMLDYRAIIIAISLIAAGVIAYNGQSGWVWGWFLAFAAITALSEGD